MISTDLGDMTLSASTGSSYIGEHYLNNLSVINGAAVETLDVVNYTNLNITGGFLQTNNVILSGKLNNQNNLFTLFAKLIKNLFNSQQLNETENPDHPVNPVKKAETVRLASLSPVSSDSEVVISDAGSAIQLPAIEKKRSDVTLSQPKGLVSNSTNTQRSNETGNLLNPVNPVKDSEILTTASNNRTPDPRPLTTASNNLTPDPRSLTPVVTGGVDPQYTYDIMNNRASMIDPTGTTTYTYDVMERLTSITNQNNETTTFTYDAISRRTSMIYPNGVVTTYIYNADNWLTGMSTDIGATNISSYSYTHDGVGNRLSMTDNDGSHTYIYDDVYRLTNATHPQAYNPTETFTYDPVGNRQTSQISSSYVYDSLNRLDEDDQYTYSYDNNGNLLSKTDKVSSAVTTYQYDSENRLVQVT